MPGLRTAKTQTEPELRPRQRLLQAVLHGRLTPAEAEAEAEQLGVGPLLDRPDPSGFNPMLEDRWTLAMTIAWIVWRTPEAVREHWPAYVIRCERWREVVWNEGEGTPTYRGFEPGPLPMPSWPLLALREDYPRQRTRAAPWRPRSPHDAREELWKALEQGDIESDAIDVDTTKRVDIPAAAWKQLDLYPELEWDIVRESPFSRSGYEAIYFPRRQVVDAWPDRALSEFLPPLVTPEGSGYMPLSAAAHWIAMKGGTIEVGHDPTAWEDSYRQLTDRIAAGQVETTAVSEKTGQRQKLEPALFGAIRIRHLFGTEEIADADSPELYLWASPCPDEEHWYAGFSDDLRQRRRTIWSKLLVSNADIAEWWPKPRPTERPRGLGRPSDKDLVIAECRRRIASGEAIATLAGEARVLAKWLKDNYADAVLTTPGTVENNIRDAHGAFRKSHERR